MVGSKLVLSLVDKYIRVWCCWTLIIFFNVLLASCRFGLVCETYCSVF
jgi:hypothetical protein